MFRQLLAAILSFIIAAPAFSNSYDNAGNLASVTYPNGVVPNYTYNTRNRLTNETIASDPSGMNGAVSYTYDPVGNRTQKVSTLPGYPGGLTNYNANDQLNADTYDNDGNTTASNGVGYAYDFENHLVQQAGLGIRCRSNALDCFTSMVRNQEVSHFVPFVPVGRGR
jgi:YD repeat-containing protein